MNIYRNSTTELRRGIAARSPYRFRASRRWDSPHEPRRTYGLATLSKAFPTVQLPCLGLGKRDDAYSISYAIVNLPFPNISRFALQYLFVPLCPPIPTYLGFIHSSFGSSRNIL